MLKLTSKNDDNRVKRSPSCRLFVVFLYLLFVFVRAVHIAFRCCVFWYFFAREFV